MTSEAGPAAPARPLGPPADIAVIGMAVRLPDAEDLRQLRRNLREGRDGVRPLTAERRRRTGLRADVDYQVGGYLDGIGEFDHTFFGVSLDEANAMAPEHRLLLQVVHHAVENAGYAPGSLAGSRTCVLVGDTRIEYAGLAGHPDASLAMGTHAAATAGRVARFFQLHGTAAMVDSSCSSSLVALRQAVHELRLGCADLALVAGVKLELVPARPGDDRDPGIRSPDGKTRCFSDRADGTGSGEAVVAVLLKPLAAALRDGDAVQAVVKGVASNNVGGRSSMLTAPDSRAQAAVIADAWSDAAVDPRTITYIEAHGTATRLGDPIEVEAIDAAFRAVTGDTGFCALSSVKSNIGHTWSASGLVGLVKAVLALRHAELYPNVHTDALSPLIDFAQSAVTVTRRHERWMPACGVRRAGVSALGLMGTNAHVVLEQAPPAPAAQSRQPERLWFPVSAKTPAALARNLRALSRWLQAAEERPSPLDVHHTLVAGRDHNGCRAAVVAAGGDELVALLGAASDEVAARAGPPPAATTIVVLSETAPPPDDGLARLRCQDERVERFCHTCEEATPVRDAAFRSFATQYVVLSLLRLMGLRTAAVITHGLGRHVRDAVEGRVPPRAALQGARAAHGAGTPPDLHARLLAGPLAELASAERVVFVELGPDSVLGGLLREVGGSGRELVTLGPGPGDLPRFLADLYAAGAGFDWRAAAAGGRRVELPGYQFERTWCWLADPDAASA